MNLFFSKVALDFNHYDQLGASLAGNYQENNPFPHIVIDNFLPRRIAEKLLKKFPLKESDIWLDWKERDLVNQPKKQGIGHASRLIGSDSFVLDLLGEMNSFTIVNFLEQLTGIEKLLVDHTFLGGGLHQTLPGGKLNIHSDFTYHRNLDVYRRINLLLFLNKNWSPGYGGALELWDADMEKCVHTIQPDFNRCVIFNTGADSYHGHPAPLSCPDNITRKSIALYYYTSAPQAGVTEKVPTTWKEPSQS
jgi:Rps23 Pro-64 3,4-dihydroxylase Tpa1-like proline 4-hydroxylase